MSRGVFESMNLGFNRGDSDENVRENFRRICKALDMDVSRLCFSKQTHTKNVITVDEKDAGNGIEKPLPYDDVDGIIDKIRAAGYEVFIEPNDIVIPSVPEFHARMAFCYGPLGEEIEFFREK